MSYDQIHAKTKRTQVVSVRFSPEERAAIARAAAQADRRISDLIRLMVTKTLKEGGKGQ